MADFRLNVFYTVAKRLSFTKAAAELFITQPAVTKHIHELENEFGAKLFERNGNRISLTAQGQLLLNHAEQIFDLYRSATFEINALSDEQKGVLRIGASTTVAQYIIAPLLAQFRNKFSQVKLSLITGNTTQVEKELIDKSIDIAIVEGHTKNPEIHYRKFLKDEIVLACGSRHPLANRAYLKSDELKAISLVMREQGSGTQEVIERGLAKAGFTLSEMNIEIRLGSTESIKSYLINSTCMAFVSVHAIANELKRGELKVIDIKNLVIEREFYLVNLHGKVSGLAELFSRFSLASYNIK